MKFKTKQEKRAFRMGLAAGSKKVAQKHVRDVEHKAKGNGTRFSTKPRKQKNKPKSSSLDYSKYFDFDERGHIKGSYTVDGFFEPD